MSHEHKFLIGTSWRTSPEVTEIRAPFDQSVVGITYQATDTDVQDAIVAAVEGFDAIKHLGSYERSALLNRIASGITARAEELAQTLAAEAGKPIKAARVEVERSAFTFSIAAEEARRINGEYLPLDWAATSAGRFGIVRRFPIGPITGISPFNFPINLVAHKVAPALAAGNSILIKPSPQTPLTALKLAEIVESAGAPAGTLTVLPCPIEHATPLITDDRIKMLTFTGSVQVGWKLKSLAGKKKVTLELGGNAGVIVHSDADVEHAANRAVIGGFGYAGQVCISVQRILVHRPVLNRFLDLFVPKVEALKIGNPLDETTDVGPLINEAAAVRVENWIQEAVAGGATCLTGGKRDGSCVTPTVLTNTDPEMRVNCQEIFGPVVTVEGYDEFEQAVESINASPFGLQAGIFSNDMRAVLKAYETLEIGGLIVGDIPTYRIDHMPYGGVKDSGFGREGLKYAIEEMTEPRLLVVCR